MDTSKEAVKRILMDRDGMSAEDAQELIDQTQEEIDMEIGECSLDAIEDIIRDNLGLEPDYVDSFIPLW